MYYTRLLRKVIHIYTTLYSLTAVCFGGFPVNSHICTYKSKNKSKILPIVPGEVVMATNRLSIDTLALKNP